MGKRLIAQARGKGGPKYRARSHAYFGKIAFPSPSKDALKGQVLDIVHSAGHSAPLMLVKYENGEVALLPATQGIRANDVVYAGERAPAQLGCITPVGSVPVGQPVHNIERAPYNGPELVRTAGAAAIVVGKEGNKVLVKLPSKKTLLLDPRCRVTVGVIAGGGHKEKPWVKAGKKFIALRARGGRVFPKVSGVAQNAVDHPFGATHRRTKGRPTTTRRKGIPAGRKVGLLAARKTGRKK